MFSLYPKSWALTGFVVCFIFSLPHPQDWAALVFSWGINVGARLVSAALLTFLSYLFSYKWPSEKVLMPLLCGSTHKKRCFPRYLSPHMCVSHEAMTQPKSQELNRSVSLAPHLCSHVRSLVFRVSRLKGSVMSVWAPQLAVCRVVCFLGLSLSFSSHHLCCLALYLPEETWFL